MFLQWLLVLAISSPVIGLCDEPENDADSQALTEEDRAGLALIKPGVAHGEFMVAGRTTKLTIAYAVVRREFPGDPETLEVILSDAPIPENVLLEGFGMQQLASDGQVHAVQIEFEPDGKPKGGVLHNSGFSDGSSHGIASLSTSGMHHFAPETLDGKMVSGKLFMKEVGDFMDTEYHYSAIFRAAVLRKPPPTYEGTAAAASPPGKAVVAFLKAAGAGKKAALKKLIEPAMAAELDGPEGPSMLKMLKTMFAPGFKVVEVTLKGDSAEVLVVKKEGTGRESMKLFAVRRGGTWRLGMGPGGEEAPEPREPPTPEQIAAAESEPGRLLMAFVDAIRSKDVAAMKALSANPDNLKDLEGPMAQVMLDMLAMAFPWDLRIIRVTQTDDTAVIEAETRMVNEAMVVNAVRIDGVWKIADDPK
jgi:hypothetical protein